MKFHAAFHLGFLVCLSICLTNRPAGAQDDSGLVLPTDTTPEIKVTPTTATREGLIHLDFATRDDAGRSVADLAAKDFKLLDNGEPSQILSFHSSNPDQPEQRLAEAGLVIDEVDLAPAQLEAAKAAAIAFLRRNGGALAQPTSVFWLKSDGLYATTAPTTDGIDLAEEIAQNHAPRLLAEIQIGSHLGLSLRNAIWDKALRSLYVLAIQWRNKPGRKALVWIGYGWSVLGTMHPKGVAFSVMEELSTRIREARMVVYEVSPWPDPENPVVDKTPTIDFRTLRAGVRSPSDPAMRDAVPRLALPVLAFQSGGLVLDNSQGLERDITHCLDDAGSFYSVSFDPPHAALPDEYHDLMIRSETTQTSVPTNRGYYNQPVFYDQPRSPAKSVSVAELKQQLDQDSAEQDRKLAQQLDDLEMTERVSTVNLAHLRAGVPGKQAQSAITALADSSVFLAPPDADVLHEPPPDDAEQHLILLQTENYLDESLPRLPDFSADSLTVKYEQPSPSDKDTWKTALENRSLLETVSERATLLYRNGHEQRYLEGQKGKRKPAQNDLNYRGIFGPVLEFVLEDVRRGKSKLIFSRWEKSDRGNLAVFRYSVAAENPKYGVVFCCLPDGSSFDTLPEHHGELAIDPATGAILRLTVESEPGWIRENDMLPLRPVLLSNMMVEYGPVDIGGTKYICPLRSVVITRERTVRPVHFWDLGFRVNGPYETLMNDTTYTNYHKFGAELRVLPGFDEMPGGKSPPAANQPQPHQH